jgi:hypothetical protein
LRYGSNRGVNHQVDLPGNQILHGGRGSAIGYELKSRACEFLEECAAYPPGISDDTLRGLVRVGLQPVDKALQVIRRNCFLGDDQPRIAGQKGDRLKILQQVVGKRVERAIQDMCAPLPAADRIAIGRRACDPADTDIACGATHVLDND